MVQMSNREQLKLDVVARVLGGGLERCRAQQILQVSERTFRRYIKTYEKKGLLFVKHGNCQKSPKNKISPAIKSAVKKLVLEKYFDFNVLHLQEMLLEKESISVKRETLRKWLHEIHMMKKKHKRRSKARYKRPRMIAEGLMLQMDGSPHRWFGGIETCLVAAIDDATSEVPYAEFSLGEETMSYMRVLRRIIELKGIPQILYVDRAGIFGGQKRQLFSQFKRATEELGINIIFAHSPEGKGRIERLFATLQDRMTAEFRIAGVKTIPAANAFMNSWYLPERHNKKFRIEPGQKVPAYKPLPVHVDLKEIFCLKELRQVKSDHTISWNGTIYLVEHELKHSIKRQMIEIRTYPDGLTKAYFGAQQIKLQKFEEQASCLEAS